MTLSIVDFLNDRMEEDRILAQAAIDDLNGPDDCYFDTSNRHIVDHYLRHEPERVLREVESKLALIHEHDEVECCSVCLDDVDGCPTFRTLAYVYAGQPDYQEHWKP
jgi:hypothetical protein